MNIETLMRIALSQYASPFTLEVEVVLDGFEVLLDEDVGTSLGTGAHVHVSASVPFTVILT